MVKLGKLPVPAIPSVLYPAGGLSSGVSQETLIALIQLFASINELILDENSIILADEDGLMLGGL